VRTGGIDVGIILSKASKEGGVTKWMVSVDGGSDDEEMISEKMLGRILETSESDDNDNSSSKSAMVDKTVKQPPAKKASKEKSKHVAGGASDANRRVNTRAATKMGGTHQLFSGLDATRKAPAKPKKKQGDETVVEVEMRTGTLFIYRGNHPRVEFVRTV
jgi:hypothetical protein